MSDYKHETVVRLPFPKELIFKNGDDPWDSEDELKEKLGDLWENGNTYTFKLGYTDDAYYIDWCYYFSYGEESGEWGTARALSENELNVIKPYFDKLKCNYSEQDLRIVDYCYYNCSEPPDYYEIDEDDSGLFFKRR